MYDIIIIGSGPAGLSAAIYAQRACLDTIVIEKNGISGGQVLNTWEVDNYPGFPGVTGFELSRQFREHANKLGARVVQDEVVQVELSGNVKKVVCEEETYEARCVILASGAHHRTLEVPGEEELRGAGVSYCATCDGAFFRGRTVAVVGGGNVAMDAARCAKRLGAEQVYIVYRRGMAELPARKEEVEHAEEEGIIFKTLCNPVEIHANDEGFVKSITCIEMELGEPDASGRRRPIEKKGSEFELDVDTVIMSLGTSPNPLIRSTTPGLETNKHGCIVTEGDEGKTSREGVYAGGDAVTGAATVIKAMGAGKAAAKAIDEYIQSK